MAVSGSRPSGLTAGAPPPPPFTASRVSIVTTVEAGGCSTRAFRVLLIDNRPERRELMRHLLAGTGLVAPEVAEAATAGEATAMLARADLDVDVVVIEIQLPVALGLEMIAALRAQSPALRIVVCSFHGDETTKAQAAAQGADAYLDKPVSSLSLQDLLRGFAEDSPSWLMDA
ncbi:MAG: two-component system, OmpR family, operon response regulator KdpE [Actinomycetota bacterium]|jgi:CheY-like chemotaxis protein|nr:two-component system, OmpR family, operon response regulator KdpE [Actinomycetota bacterium]